MIKLNTEEPFKVEKCPKNTEPESLKILRGTPSCEKIYNLNSIKNNQLLIIICEVTVSLLIVKNLLLGILCLKNYKPNTNCS